MSPHRQHRGSKREVLSIFAFMAVVVSAPTILPYAAETIPDLVTPFVTAFLLDGNQ